jgi:N-formylglutamate amidohydrolase
MAFNIGSTSYSAGTYDLKMSMNPAQPMKISTEDGRHTQFALTGAAMQHTDKTRERGPVVVLKCAYKGCFVTEIWTEEQGFTMSHPKSIDEKLASTTHVVALTRVARR